MNEGNVNDGIDVGIEVGIVVDGAVNDGSVYVDIVYDGIVYVGHVYDGTEVGVGVGVSTGVGDVVSAVVTAGAPVVCAALDVTAGFVAPSTDGSEVELRTSDVSALKLAGAVEPDCVIIVVSLCFVPSPAEVLPLSIAVGFSS